MAGQTMSLLTALAVVGMAVAVVLAANKWGRK